MIYLDNNATTRVAPEVTEAMLPFLRDVSGNPHSIHAAGRKSHDAVERARSEVAELLGSKPAEIVFTSCGSESNALALRGLVRERRNVVTTSVEHPSVLALLRWMEDRGEIGLAIAPVSNDGAIDVDEIVGMIDSSTAVVSVMLAQNETGVIHDIAPIRDAARSAGALLHIDAVQAAGKIAIDVDQLGADLLSISGHKLHAPKGIGALYVRSGTPLEPLWQGGGQEFGLRSGTEPVPQIVALGAACRLAGSRLVRMADVEALRNRFEARLAAEEIDHEVNGATQPRLPNTSHVSFHGRVGADLVAEIDRHGVCASAGAACHSGVAKLGAVMQAMGRNEHRGLGAVRFSLSHETTAEEIDEAVAIVARAVGAAVGH